MAANFKWSIHTWCAYIVSYTSVQNTPDAYRGSTTEGSILPLMAAQPNKAPQLKVKPRKAWGCTNRYRHHLPNQTVGKRSTEAEKGCTLWSWGQGERERVEIYWFERCSMKIRIYYPKCKPLHEGVCEDQQQGWSTQNAAAGIEMNN